MWLLGIIVSLILIVVLPRMMSEVGFLQERPIKNKIIGALWFVSLGTLVVCVFGGLWDYSRIPTDVARQVVEQKYGEGYTIEGVTCRASSQYFCQSWDAAIVDPEGHTVGTIIFDRSTGRIVLSEGRGSERGSPLFSWL